MFFVDHPRVSADERIYLARHACTKTKEASKKAPLSWSAFFTCGQVYILAITMFCTVWTHYIISLNIPLLVNDIFHASIILVRIF